MKVFIHKKSRGNLSAKKRIILRRIFLSLVSHLQGNLEKVFPAMKELPVQKSVEAYIAQFAEGVQVSLRQLRETILAIAPQAEENISYQMPAYKYHGVLVYFAGYKNHIGLYPTPAAIDAFKKELAGYKTSKGAIQFALDKPLPLALIKKIVQWKMKENLHEERLKAPTKKEILTGKKINPNR